MDEIRLIDIKEEILSENKAWADEIRQKKYLSRMEAEKQARDALLENGEDHDG